MTEFIDGPAIGLCLSLGRAPKYLRVVRSNDGKWDALDQLEDKAAPNELILVYIRVGEPRFRHIDYAGYDAHGRRSSSHLDAVYRIKNKQPRDQKIRDNSEWRRWVISR